MTRPAEAGAQATPGAPSHNAAWWIYFLDYPSCLDVPQHGVGCLLRSHTMEASRPAPPRGGLPPRGATSLRRRLRLDSIGSSEPGDRHVRSILPSPGSPSHFVPPSGTFLSLTSSVSSQWLPSRGSEPPWAQFLAAGLRRQRPGSLSAATAHRHHPCHHRLFEPRWTSPKGA